MFLRKVSRDFLPNPFPNFPPRSTPTSLLRLFSPFFSPLHQFLFAIGIGKKQKARVKQKKEKEKKKKKWKKKKRAAERYKIVTEGVVLNGCRPVRCWAIVFFIDYFSYPLSLSPLSPPQLSSSGEIKKEKTKPNTTYTN